jgi:hypothetical protein
LHVWGPKAGVLLELGESEGVEFEHLQETETSGSEAVLGCRERRTVPLLGLDDHIPSDQTLNGGHGLRRDQAAVLVLELQDQLVQDPEIQERFLRPFRRDM